MTTNSITKTAKKIEYYSFFSLLLALCLTIIIYYPGLTGPFIFDDIFNIQNNIFLRLQNLDFSTLSLAAFSTESGPLQRPLSMLSFGLNYYFFGEETTSFKAINLAIHLINGVLIFLLARLLLQLAAIRCSDPALANNRISIAAALIAALWLVHPLNLTSVLYVVQRMASLSALFVLLSLLTYIKGRQLYSTHRFLALALWTLSVLFWACGLASKENAALLPWYIFLIEWLFFYPLKQPTARTRGYTFAWFVVPFILGLVYIAMNPGMLSYDSRPFTLWERFFTEIRALWFYVGLIILPRPTTLGIFHDDFPLSTGLFEPWSTLPAVLGLLIVVIFALRLYRRFPLLSFGILFFLAAHVLESSIFPLEIMHEHRNYLAAFGILFGIISSLLFANNELSKPKLLIPVFVIFVVFFGAITFGRAINWQDISRIILAQVDRHPESAGSNYEAGRLHIELRDQTTDWLQKDDFNAKAIQYFSKMAALKPKEATGLLAVLFANASNSKPTEKSIILETSRRLQKGLIPDVTLSLLLGLSQCDRKDTCFMQEDQVDVMLEAALQNSRLYKNQQAALFDELALRTAQEGLFTEAETFFKKAISVNSVNAFYRLNYASLLIHIKKFEEARQQIEFVLATSQPSAIIQGANMLLARMEQDPEQQPSVETPKAANKQNRFLLNELAKPKNEENNVFDLLQGLKPKE